MPLLLMASCSVAPPASPFVDGRLAKPAFVELAGQPSQIATIEAFARTQGWTLDCRGKAGALVTMRLKFPQGTTQTVIEDYFFGNLSQPAPAMKITMVYDPVQRSPNCVRLP
jgi:hypothetical protein